MSEGIIIAIIGQCVTLLIVLIQQIFNHRNLKLQIKNNNKKEYCIEKRNAYKLLISKINIDFLTSANSDLTYFDFFFKEVYLYASKNIIEHVTAIYRQYKYLKENKLTKNEAEIKFKILGYSIRKLQNLVKEEYENI